MSWVDCPILLPNFVHRFDPGIQMKSYLDWMMATMQLTLIRRYSFGSIFQNIQHYSGWCASNLVILGLSLISFETVLASVWLLQDQLECKKNSLLQVDQSSVRNSYSVFSLLRWEFYHVTGFITAFSFTFKLGKWLQLLLEQLCLVECHDLGVLFTLVVNQMDIYVIMAQFLKLDAIVSWQKLQLYINY